MYSLKELFEDISTVENEIRDKLSALEVKILNFRSHAIKKGKHESSVAKKSSVNLNRIWGCRLGLKNYALIERKKPGDWYLQPNIKLHYLLYNVVCIAYVNKYLR